MFQCQFGQACGEDWYHEECIMGLKPNTIDRRPHPKDGVGRHHLSSKPGQNATSDEKQPVVDVSEAEEEEEDDGEDILPMPGFPNLETFDTIVCWICVSKFKVEFDRLAILLDCQKVYHVKANSIEERETLLNGTRNNSGGAKRTKQDFPYTILLKKDFKKQIKHTVIENKPENRSLIKLLKEFPYMYDSDPIYKPPEDSDDDNSSVFELGLKELSKVPVEQAITGMQAYDKIKSKLTEFLRPFAEQKKIVTEEEVKKFFSKEMADKK
ncbi:DEKNAAC100408 [Brettanomyces naardenensis]|uniref:DEKNAAC100408 n=1 Tax=Brettanomyces naardenensis TaxID=13370 RepID=A0A448YGB3_BRENA|nr:DEKNAAC100408 [Brettanomyces naardenensis]